MLGPSGSGKTTMLRLIAGFELPTDGTIELDGRDVSDDPPFDRDVNTVFQDYALFPHMDVARNVEYGLRVKKVPKAERGVPSGGGAGERPARADLATRKPNQLSGGQRQRVALGPCAGQPTEGAPARRAARRPRPQAPRADAGGAQGAPARGGHHLRLRHPRPGRGPLDERPGRGVQPRPDRAGGLAARRLRAPGHGVRGRLRRHGQPPARRRRARHRPPGAHPLRRTRRRRDGRHRHRRRRAVPRRHHPLPGAHGRWRTTSRSRSPTPPRAPPVAVGDTVQLAWRASDRQRVGAPLADALSTD